MSESKHTRNERMTHAQAAKYPFYGHDDGLVVSQPESGKFVERPMTPAELAAREPAHQIAQDIYRHANYAGVCYAELWDIIAKAMQKLLDERAADEPSSVAVNEPVFYRCETCKEIMLATHLVGADGHDRIEETSEGQPYQVPCGPVRPSILSAGEYINRFLPANWLKDSSLETWFPLVAEEIERLQRELADARAEIARLKRRLV